MPSKRIHILHSSMQFSDTDKQHVHDADKVMSLGADIITGTEASGVSNLRGALQRAAEKQGYKIYIKSDTWVAVEKAFIHGAWDTHSEMILPGKAGQYSGKYLMGVSFQPKAPVGRIHVLAGHYVTKGRPGSGELSQREDENRKLAAAIGGYAKKHGSGKDIVFYGGDQNIPDNLYHTFFGAPLTSCWDELDKHPGTGHGNIDVIASYNGDRRVKCAQAKVWEDKNLFLHTDHFLMGATYEVELMKDKSE